MASQAIAIPQATFIFLLLVLVCVGQGQGRPALSECASLFLPLTACAPFVQGIAQAPGKPCCYNLNQLYGQQPQCLCLVLGDTPISSAFPINRTLALQLPSLCSLRLSASTTCSGTTTVAKSPASSHVSLGANDNSTTAVASPSPTSNDQMPRGHTTVGLGLARSKSIKASRSNNTALVAAMLFLFTGVIHYTHSN